MEKANDTLDGAANAVDAPLPSTLQKSAPSIPLNPGAAEAPPEKVKTEHVNEGYPADPDFQLRGGYANLMLDAAAPLFGLVMRLRTLDALPNIKDVHQKVRNQIDNIREEMRQHGYEPAQLLA